MALEQESTAGHFTPGAIDGSYVVATKQYRTIISIHKRGAAAKNSSYHINTDHKGGNTHRAPHGGSSEGTQRGDGRRAAVTGGGRYRKRAAQQAAVTQKGRLSRRPLQKAGASAGGRYIATAR